MHACTHSDTNFWCILVNPMQQLSLWHGMHILRLQKENATSKILIEAADMLNNYLWLALNNQCLKTQIKF
jgi:hypothetical protein